MTDYLAEPEAIEADDRLKTAAAPGWIDELRDRCDRKSQAAVARRLGVSTTVISQVLCGKYPSPTGRIQALIEGAYMDRAVYCPVLGPLAADRCEHYQAATFQATNSQRVRVYRACHHTCPHSRVREDA